MSAFEIKNLSEQDAFRLDKAKKEEADALQSDVEKGAAPTAFDPGQSPVAKVVEQIMSHWADADEHFVHEVAEQSGDPNLKRIVGQAQAADLRPAEGMTGDFQADAAGPVEGIEVPPRADGGEFGGGGGGGSGGGGAGGGGGGDAELPGWQGDNDGGLGDPGDMPDAGDLPGFSMETEGEAAYGGGGGGGGGGGEDPNPLAPPKPPDPKKPKNP